MKKTKRCQIFFLASMLALLAYSPLLAINAKFDCKSFFAPSAGPYLETYLSVDGQSVRFPSNNNQKLQGKVEIWVEIMQDSTKIINDHYTVSSPEVDSLSQITFDFIATQRYQLKEGKYKIRLKIADFNNKASHSTGTIDVELYYPNDKIGVSDVLLLKSFEKIKNNTSTNFTKSGFDVMPSLNAFFGNPRDTLKTYFEIYNTKLFEKDSLVLAKYFIEDAQTQAIYPRIGRFQKINPCSVLPVFNIFALDELPTGNYNLVVELRDINNQIIGSKKIPFERLNNNRLFANEEINLDNVYASASFADAYTYEQLDVYIRSLFPIANIPEKRFAESIKKSKEKNEDLMKRYFINFWEKRNPLNPQKAWEIYYAEVQKTQKEFGNKKILGFGTERGRVYLQYGPPNNRTVVTSDPNAYPYEIWWYYQVGTRTNVRFVFLNRFDDTDFQLIFSDANGEPQNPDWRQMVFARNNTNATPLQGDFNSRSRLEQNFRGQ